jgi:hypothetical protein
MKKLLINDDDKGNVLKTGPFFGQFVKISFYFKQTENSMDVVRVIQANIFTLLML